MLSDMQAVASTTPDGRSVKPVLKWQQVHPPGRDILILFKRVARGLAFIWVQPVLLVLGLLFAIISEQAADAQGASSEVAAVVNLPACGEQQNPDQPQWVLNQGHTGKVTRIAVNADASLLLTSGEDNSARVWNVSRGSLVHALIGETHDQKLTSYNLSATFLDDRNVVLSGNRVGMQSWTPGTVTNCVAEPFTRRWLDHVESDGLGAAIVTTQMPLAPSEPAVWTRGSAGTAFIRVDFPAPVRITAVAVAVGGRAFAIGGIADLSANPQPGEVIIWDNQRRTVVGRFPLASGAPRSIQFTPDGQGIRILTPAGLFQLTIATHSLRQVLPGNFTQAAASSTGQYFTLKEQGESSIVEVHDVATGGSQVIAAPRAVAARDARTPSAIALNRREDQLALAFSDGAMGVWSIDRGVFTAFWEAPRSGIEGDVVISRNGNAAAIRDGSYVQHVDLSTGLQRKLEKIPEYEGFSIPYDVGIMGEEWRFNTTTSISPDGGLVASGVYWSGRIGLWDTRTLEKIRDIPLSSQGPFGLAFSDDGGWLFARHWADIDDDSIAIQDARSGKALPRTVTKLPVIEHLPQILYTRLLPAGQGLVAGLYSGSVAVYSQSAKPREIPLLNRDDFVVGLDVDRTGRLAAVGYRSDQRRSRVDLISIATGERRSISLNGQITSVEALRMFPSGSHVIVGGVSSIGVFSTNTLQLVATLPIEGRLLDLEIAPDSRIMTVKVEGAITLYELSDPSKPQELITYTNLQNEVPFVSTPNGFFSTAQFENINAFSWLLPDAPLVPLRPEIFMRDYYEPKLLPRLLANDPSLKRPVRPLGSLNRTQPEVGEPEATADAGGEFATVRVRVKSVSSEVQKDAQGPLQSGVYDLRLFRDGQLVGWAPRDSAKWQSDSSVRGSEADGIDLPDWRKAHQVKAGLPEVERVEADGTMVVRFEHVRLPRRAGQMEVVFSAYAFNEDRVKSTTASKSIPSSAELKPRIGKAYVISVGVNRTRSTSAWDLSYAVNDARELSRVVSRKLREAKQFDDVVPVCLVSDDARAAVKSRCDTELPATKESLQAVVDLLAGRAVKEPIRTQLGKIAERAQPEDLVLISVSSHGYTDDRGTFHFVTADVNLPQVVTAELDQVTLNTDQLSSWLREVDAGELVLIVDACQSEATIKTEGFKPGPMGSRGLGQLAYDKGMRVLAASKARESAYERDKIGHGLLSYALVTKGLEEGEADWQPKDNRITMSEWLSYAEQEVPKLFTEGEAKGGVQRKGAPNGARDVYHGQKKTPDRYQQPTLFDFAKQSDTEIAPMSDRARSEMGVAALILYPTLPVAQAQGGQARVRGSVVMPNGKLAEDVLVTLSGPEDKTISQTRTKNGAFEFSPAPVGKWSVYVSVLGYCSDVGRVVVRTGAIAYVEPPQLAVHTCQEIRGSNVNYPVQASAISPDGRMLAISDGDSILVRDLGTKTIIASWRYPWKLRAIAVNSNGSKVVTARVKEGDGVEAIVWDTSSSARLLLSIDAKDVKAISFNFRGDHFATAHDGERDEGYVWIWDLQGKWNSQGSWPGVVRLNFTPGGELLIWNAEHLSITSR